METIALLPKLSAWFERSANVQAAVLFGSSARARTDSPEQLSDLDFHVVASDAQMLERVDWDEALTGVECRFQVARPATGAVRKVTALFGEGQMDLVIVPARLLRMALFAQRFGWDHRLRFVGIALNEMATCLHTGYRFIKGETQWGSAYARVSRREGVRLSRQDVVGLADVFVCDLLWALQKVDRGELIAAQHVLHTKLSDTNLRLWREVRFRRGKPLPSFGLGRRIEALAERSDRARLEVSARLDPTELATAIWGAWAALRYWMQELEPGWAPAAGVTKTLDPYRLRLRAE